MEQEFAEEGQSHSGSQITLINLIESIEFDRKSKKKSPSETDSFSSCHSDTKEKSKVWTRDELELFDILLKQMGTDFTVLSKFFPKKTKNQIKNKYKQKYNFEKKYRREENSKLLAVQQLFKEAAEHEEDN